MSYPISGPGTAYTTRHVSKIEYDQATRVVCFVTRQANAGASVGCDVLVISANVYSARSSADVAFTLGCRPINVVYESMCWICFSPK